MKKRVVVLGAGLVARPLVRYLLDHGFAVTVATRTVSKAEALIERHPDGKAVAWTIDDAKGLRDLVASSDLTVSLLPAMHHPVAARLCVELRKHMVTTSYVSPQMRELDGPARGADVLLLNEIGVDPGIDHMSIMQILDEVTEKRGRLTALRSYCGGLPAPEANTNPLGYKFSWSPAGVLSAMTNPSKFRADGRIVDLPPGGLFDQVHEVPVEGLPRLEAYPNRDSLSYIELYQLGDIATMLRGTLRYPGWCALWKPMFRLGLLDRTERHDLGTKSWADLLSDLAGGRSRASLRKRLAAKVELEPTDEVFDRMEWLGLFSDATIGDHGSVLDGLSVLLLSKLTYGARERDMLVMKHLFSASYPDGRKEAIESTMLDFGVPGGDSSMARTVSIPAAIASRLVLEGKIGLRGVQIPVVKEVYGPVLSELSELGIRLSESRRPA